MTLLQNIKDNLQNRDITQLIKKLGYHSTEKGFTMLNKLLASATLHEWLKSSNYDLVYESESFLKALCDALEIDKGLYEKEVRQAKSYNAELDRFSASYIFVNTDFKRTSEPIHALAACEGLRNLPLKNKDALVGKTFDEIVQQVSKMIQQHYIDNAGTLGIWREIKNYVLHIDDKTLLFDTNGVFIDTDPQIFESRASLNV